MKVLTPCCIWWFYVRKFFFAAVKLTKNADFDNAGIGFYARGSFSLFDGSRSGKNVIIFGADMSLSGHVDDRKNIYLNFW